MLKSELLPNIGSEMVYNIECYPNYFVCVFLHVPTDSLTIFEQSPDSEIDYDFLNWVMYHFKLIGFNSNSYDKPMMAKCLEKVSCGELKEFSDRVVKDGLPWNAPELKALGRIDHADLFEITKKASLEILAARMNAEKVESQPIDVDLHLTQEQGAQIREYCIHKVVTTKMLLGRLREQLDLRISLSQEYGVDLRSKSDAQIAEAVIVSELEEINGHRPKKLTIDLESKYKYNPPEWMKFQSPELQKLLDIAATTEFGLTADGRVEKHKNFNDYKIKLGEMIYKVGIGGLHSTEKSSFKQAVDGYNLVDIDAASFYPTIILNQNLFPTQCGERFVNVYRSIVERRLAAKDRGDLVVANTLKIVINGSFGKFGSQYSALFSPQLMLQTTITGQLALMMLIEQFVLNSISVVSANTDGIVVRYHDSQKDLYKKIVKNWEEVVNYKMEANEYLLIAAESVNSYIAVAKKWDKSTKSWLNEPGKIKYKGSFSDPDHPPLDKNSAYLIYSKAIGDYLAFGKTIENTITNCQDISKFAAFQMVKGGAKKDSLLLGKVARWYQAKGEKGCLHYVSNDHKVPCTEGAKPLMIMQELPIDIDYDFYIKEANDILYDLGVKVRKRGLW